MPVRMIIISAWVAAVLLACGGEKRPKNILTEKEFSALLVDVYLAEAKLAVLRVNQDSAMRLFGPYEDQLLKKRNITRPVLKETYRYYIEHPGAFEKIYENVMDTLSLRERRAQAAKDAADSVRRTSRVPSTNAAKKKEKPLRAKPKPTKGGVVGTVKGKKL